MKIILTIAALVMAATVAPASTILNDNFSYADGSLTNVSGGKWSNHSGTVGQVDVVTGRLFLTEAESEDVNALLTGQPYTAAGGATLYSSFTINFSALPSGTGAYFAHFKDPTTGFRGRVFASTTNAAPNSFRLGIGNSSNASATSGQLAGDLSLNTTYTVVTRYNLGTGLSTIWLNPLSESSPSATASDAPGPIDITAYAFRQSLATGNGMGSLFVDDLKIGTSFADVAPIPEPAIYGLLGLGMAAFLARRTLFSFPGRIERSKAEQESSLKHPDPRLVFSDRMELT